MVAVEVAVDTVEEIKVVRGAIHMCYEQRESRNIVMGEGQGTGSPQEDGTQANDAAAIVNSRPGGTVQVHDGLQISQQQSQNSIVQWERFLPTRSIKVLLVENDDSTRHVVSALLRNCSYEVTGVANGLQAWRVLEDFNNHIDLILTEVAMPIVSGIGLLCKIMSHKTFKNIPVIMMSSRDSMGIVFKCLSKGAVDFLVKPIRKNELKNLWQHVWRRCHSSSGSGSESGTQTKKYVNSKGNEESENNSDSCNELDDSGSNGLSARHGSDNGSGTQSSWTKRAAEFDSPQLTSPSIQVADAPDSTCAQVIHTNPEVFGDQCIGITEKKESQEKNEEHDDVGMGKDREIRVSRKPDLQCNCLCEMTSHPIIKRQNKLSEVDSKPLENGQLEHKSENISNKLRERASKAVNANCTNLHVESKRIDVSNFPDDVLQLKDKAFSDSGGLPSLELSLKRLRGVGDGGSAANDDRNVLRHSDLSAFSKYNTSSSASQGQTGNVGSCSPLGNSSDAKKTETVHDMTCHPNGTILNQPSNGSSNNNDMASTSKKAPLKTEALNDKSESTSAFKSFNSSAFQSVQNGLVCSPQQVKSSNVDDVGHVTVQAQFRGSRQQVQVQHHHHHHHHYHHDVHVIQQHQSQPDHGDLSLKNMAEDAQQCGSSNMVGGPTEGITRNYSVNGSASGSNHGSNGKNGSNAVLNTGLTNMDSDNAAAGNIGAGGSNGRVSGNAGGEDRVAQREAALCKFRQKRKERCFEKRVRYHSRKKLAEQRPRVKGQFVRQIVSDTKPGRDSHGNDFTSEDNSYDSMR